MAHLMLEDTFRGGSVQHLQRGGASFGADGNSTTFTVHHADPSAAALRQQHNGVSGGAALLDNSRQAYANPSQSPAHRPPQSGSGEVRSPTPMRVSPQQQQQQQQQRVVSAGYATPSAAHTPHLRHGYAASPQQQGSTYYDGEAARYEEEAAAALRYDAHTNRQGHAPPPLPPADSWTTLNRAVALGVHSAAVTRLAIERVELGESPWRWLLTVVPQLPLLEHFSLRDTALSDARLAELAGLVCYTISRGAPTPAAIRHTDLTAAASATAPSLTALARLRSLDVSDNYLTAASALALGKLCLWNLMNLQALALANNAIGDHGAQVLAVYLSKMAPLRPEGSSAAKGSGGGAEVSNRARARVDSSSGTAFASRPRSEALRLEAQQRTELETRLNAIVKLVRPDAVDAAVEGLMSRCPQLRARSAHGGSHVFSSARAYTSASGNSGLNSFYAIGGVATPSRVIAGGHAERHHRFGLVSLDVSDNGLSERGVAELLTGASKSQIRLLILGGQLGQGQGQGQSDAFGGDPINTSGYSTTGYGGTGGHSVVASQLPIASFGALEPSQHCRLRFLDLSGCGIGSARAGGLPAARRLFLSLLFACQRLEGLDVGDNYGAGDVLARLFYDMGWEATERGRAAPRSLATLRALRLAGTGLSDAGAATLMHALLDFDHPVDVLGSLSAIDFSGNEGTLSAEAGANLAAFFGGQAQPVATVPLPRMADWCGGWGQSVGGGGVGFGEAAAGGLSGLWASPSPSNASRPNASNAATNPISPSHARGRSRSRSGSRAGSRRGSPHNSQSPDRRAPSTPRRRESFKLERAPEGSAPRAGSPPHRARSREGAAATAAPTPTSVADISAVGWGHRHSGGGGAAQSGRHNATTVSVMSPVRLDIMEDGDGEGEGAAYGVSPHSPNTRPPPSPRRGHQQQQYDRQREGNLDDGGGRQQAHGVDDRRSRTRSPAVADGSASTPQAVWRQPSRSPSRPDDAHHQYGGEHDNDRYTDEREGGLRGGDRRRANGGSLSPPTADPTTPPPKWSSSSAAAVASANDEPMMDIREAPYDEAEAGEGRADEEVGKKKKKRIVVRKVSKKSRSSGGLGDSRDGSETASNSGASQRSVSPSHEGYHHSHSHNPPEFAGFSGATAAGGRHSNPNHYSSSSRVVSTSGGLLDDGDGGNGPVTELQISRTTTTTVTRGTTRNGSASPARSASRSSAAARAQTAAALDDNNNNSGAVAEGRRASPSPSRRRDDYGYGYDEGGDDGPAMAAVRAIGPRRYISPSRGDVGPSRRSGDTEEEWAVADGSPSASGTARRGSQNQPSSASPLASMSRRRPSVGADAHNTTVSTTHGVSPPSTDDEGAPTRGGHRQHASPSLSQPSASASPLRGSTLQNGHHGDEEEEDPNVLEATAAAHHQSAEQLRRLAEEEAAEQQKKAAEEAAAEAERLRQEEEVAEAARRQKEEEEAAERHRQQQQQQQQHEADREAFEASEVVQRDRLAVLESEWRRRRLAPEEAARRAECEAAVAERLQREAAEEAAARQAAEAAKEEEARVEQEQRALQEQAEAAAKKKKKSDGAAEASPSSVNHMPLFAPPKPDPAALSGRVKTFSLSYAHPPGHILCTAWHGLHMDASANTEALWEARVGPEAARRSVSSPPDTNNNNGGSPSNALPSEREATLARLAALLPIAAKRDPAAYGALAADFAALPRQNETSSPPSADEADERRAALLKRFFVAALAARADSLRRALVADVALLLQPNGDEGGGGDKAVTAVALEDSDELMGTLTLAITTNDRRVPIASRLQQGANEGFEEPASADDAAPPAGPRWPHLSYYMKHCVIAPAAGAPSASSARYAPPFTQDEVEWFPRLEAALRGAHASGALRLGGASACHLLHDHHGREGGLLEELPPDIAAAARAIGTSVDDANEVDADAQTTTTAGSLEQADGAQQSSEAPSPTTPADAPPPATTAAERRAALRARLAQKNGAAGSADLAEGAASDDESLAASGEEGDARHPPQRRRGDDGKAAKHMKGKNSRRGEGSVSTDSESDDSSSSSVEFALEGDDPSEGAAAGKRKHKDGAAAGGWMDRVADVDVSAIIHSDAGARSRSGSGSEDNDANNGRPSAPDRLASTAKPPRSRPNSKKPSRSNSAAAADSGSNSPRYEDAAEAADAAVPAEAMPPIQNVVADRQAAAAEEGGNGSNSPFVAAAEPEPVLDRAAVYLKTMQEQRTQLLLALCVNSTNKERIELDESRRNKVRAGKGRLHLPAAAVANDTSTHQNTSNNNGKKDKKKDKEKKKDKSSDGEKVSVSVEWDQLLVIKRYRGFSAKQIIFMHPLVCSTTATAGGPSATDLVLSCEQPFPPEALGEKVTTAYEGTPARRARLLQPTSSVSADTNGGSSSATAPSPSRSPSPAAAGTNTTLLGPQRRVITLTVSMASSKAVRHAIEVIEQHTAVARAHYDKMIGRRMDEFAVRERERVRSPSPAAAAASGQASPSARPQPTREGGQQQQQTAASAANNRRSGFHGAPSPPPR